LGEEEMDLTIFWNQLFYPLENAVLLFFSILFALLTEKITFEMDKDELIWRDLGGFWQHLGAWLVYFVISFLIISLFPITGCFIQEKIDFNKTKEEIIKFDEEYWETPIEYIRKKYKNKKANV
jgi:TM2 domain-containing membrane protein YozV